MNHMSARHIICFGNPLHGDDGFGSCVFQTLKQQQLPKDVKLMDGGTSSLSALNLFENCRYAVVVDAERSTRKIGSLAWMSQDDLNAMQIENPMSSHGLGVSSILQGLAILKQDGEKVPELDILTCSVEEPKSFDMALSEAVQASVQPAVRQILARLERGEA